MSQRTNEPTEEGLLYSLQEVYNKRRKPDELTAEQPIFINLIPKLVAAIKPLVLCRAFALGSTATVWEVMDEKLHQRRALKLPRPRLGKIDNIIRVIRAERERLAELTHQNITKIYLSDEIEISIDNVRYSFPYFIMDYIEGVKDIDEYILDNLPLLSSDMIITYLRHVALGLTFLHGKGIIHCDIKPGNIIIGPGEVALIADLGYAKHFEKVYAEDQEKLTTVRYTPAYAHPTLLKQMVNSTDSGAAIAEIRRSELRPTFDLYAFGRTLQKILSIIRENEYNGKIREPIFSPYQWRYLALIAVRLLDGQKTKVSDGPLQSDGIPGLPQSVMPELKYNSAYDALEDLEKLLNFYDLEGEIPEVNSNLSTYIQLPGSCVPLTKRVERIINHPSFARLSQVSQLGFVSLVYPGATHTRFEHSLGTFAKCCDIVRSLWYDDVNCLFRSIMSKSDIETILVTSLLHDLGHYPIAHDLSEVDDLFTHDRFTESLIYSLDLYIGESLADVIRAEWDTDASRVIRILKADSGALFKDRLLKSIISGPLDADKLDYIPRDSMHAGITFGSDIDHGRLLRNLTICIGTDEKGSLVAEVGVKEKARSVAESVWRARREMFRQVYWHHTVRSLKAMLTYAVRRILLNLTTDAQRDKFNRDLNRFCFSPLNPVQVSSDVCSSNEQKEGGESATLTAEHIFEIEDSSYLGFSHLSSSDDNLISFLWCYADTIARNVLQMIRQRKLFRRIAVVSQDIDSESFEIIYNNFRHDRLRGHRKEQEDRRCWLEEAILDRCQEKFKKEVLGDQGIENGPIILIDVPLKALKDPPGEEALWYVPEEKIGLIHKDIFTPHAASKLETQIEKTVFDKEVGKIRVLVHPGYHEVISRYLRNEDIIKLLIDCITMKLPSA